MSFPIITKTTLVKKIEEQGVQSPFFDVHAIDAVGSCHYTTVLDDVQAGCYTFEFFIKAHVEIAKTENNYSFGQVRLLAQQSFHREATRQRHALEQRIDDGQLLGWANGVMC